MSASESASRSSTNESPSLIVEGSISRMSARRSRMSSKTLLRSRGPCSTCVSAGTEHSWWTDRLGPDSTLGRFLCACEVLWTTPGSGGDRTPELVDDTVVHHLRCDPNGIHHR